MRMTNVGFKPELVQRKVAPPLEAVTHGGLNWKLSILEFIALEITLDFRNQFNPDRRVVP